MQAVISVENLKKYYKAYEKEPGLKGSLNSIFHRKYKNVNAVDDISFKINEGELVGFIGPNGAGKTTTLKVLSGLLYPTAGKVRVLGHEPFKRERDFQKQFSLIISQKNQLWWDLPAIDSLILNKEIYEISDEKYKKTLDELVEILEVKDLLNMQVRKLSLGQRMKMELIAALIHSPKLLFLDEPTIGLDVVMQKRIRDFIKDYNQKYNSTIILTSHYMVDVKELCKRVVIIDKGKILYDGFLEKIVERFSLQRTINLEFDEQIEKNQLEEWGKIKSFDGFNASLEVKKDSTFRDIAGILEKLPVRDLTVEDPPIEDIIRMVFDRETK
nr:ATP-binding cassette domain-containing protein [Candidatus Levybacteria bacterium]